MSALEAPVRVEAHEPPEVRGNGRDDVAMLVAARHDPELVHARFRDLPRFLEPGDLLVVNTSATLPASLPAEGLELRLSTQVAPDRWLVELRTSAGERFRGGREGQRVGLPEGRSAELLARHSGGRLWLARVPVDHDFLRRRGRPIRYGYVSKAWPLEAYQTVFAREPGSAEMPSAGRPFTAELVTELVASGVLVAPVTLHTGVSSPEVGEAPYPERYDVPTSTARLVNAVHAWGGRVAFTGIPKEASQIEFQKIVLEEIDLYGVRANRNTMEEVIPLIADGRIPAARLITHHFPLKDFAEALRTFNERVDGALKVIIEP